MLPAFVRACTILGLMLLAVPVVMANGSAAAADAAAPTATDRSVVKTVRMHSGRLPSVEESDKKAPAGVTQPGKVVQAGKAKQKKEQQAENPFNMHVLIERLKQTEAIGFFTKLAIRSDALDLVEMVKAYRKHMNKYSLQELRARFNGLLLKVLALLNDDPKLAKDISLAREDIWRSLLEVKT